MEWTRVALWALILAFLAHWGAREAREHIACIQSGGDVSLGWFQDGCVARVTP